MSNSKWIHVDICDYFVEQETKKALKFELPDGYSFWHPTSMIRERGSEYYCMSLSFPETWKFVLESDYDEKKINGKQMKELLESIDMSSYRFKKKDPYELHIPPRLEPEIVEPLEELIDD